MDAQAKLARMLMNRVRNDRYPSYTEMGILESALPPQMRDEYLDMLLEKVAQESRPSITMLRHIQQLAVGA